ncbi:MAG: 4Fe-4S binding protein [Clostridiales bacterium]|nr:4Fe-4S binding protein [Clostridiales bacterium]
MAYKIDTDSCVTCGLCKANCPVDCIDEVNGTFVINANECVDCGTCEANCPVSAVSQQ